MKILGTQNSPTKDTTDAVVPAEEVVSSIKDNTPDPSIDHWYEDPEFSHMGDVLVHHLRQRFSEVKGRDITDAEVIDYANKVIKAQI